MWDLPLVSSFAKIEHFLINSEDAKQRWKRALICAERGESDATLNCRIDMGRGKKGFPSAAS